MGVLAEPLAVGAHAVRLAEVTRESTCVVLGTGTIGLLAAVAAQQAGARRVYCTDVNRYRLSIAADMGLFPIKSDEESVESVLKSAAPDGPDIVFLAVSSSAVLNQALKLVRRGGKVIVIAVFNQPIAVDMNCLQANEVDLKGSNIYTRTDFETALSILVNRQSDMRKAITHHVRFEDLSAVFEMLGDPNNEAIKVIVEPKPTFPF